jgi:acyl carrier protein
VVAVESQPPVERIRDLFRRVLAVDPPATDTDLIESGLLDSLALVELIFALEEEFGLTLPLDALELDAFRSIQTVAEFVENARRAGDVR